MTRPIAALAIAAGLAASAAAQTPSFTSDSTISMPLSWSEINGNNNGVLEPGESVEVRMNVSFSNQSGVASFAPAIATFASGTVIGFGSAFFDINGAGESHGAFTMGYAPGPANNGTSGYGVRSGWRTLGTFGHGRVNLAGNGIIEVQLGQFPASPELANTINPITRMYAFLWTPSSYAARSVTFSIAPVIGNTLASVYLDFNHEVGASVYIAPSNWSLGSVSIPIVPGPPALVTLALASLALRRSRRPRESSP